MERVLLRIVVSIDFSLGNQGPDKIEGPLNGRTCELCCLQKPRPSKLSTANMRVLVVHLVRGGNIGQRSTNDSNPSSPNKMNVETSSWACKKAGGKQNQYQGDKTRNPHIRRG